MSPETWASIAVSAVTGGCGVWAARSARRTPRQERRDDFTTVTDRLDKEIARLQQRIGEQESESARQRERIGDQDLAMGWLLARVRVLVGYIRQSGLEPPAPAPMSERARQYIHHIDV